MRFALITDVHFGPPAWFDGKLRKLSHHAHALTAEFIDAVNQVEHPDVVFNLGDVIEDATRDEDLVAYRHFCELLQGCKMDVIHVAGNHDLVNLTEEDLRAVWGHQGPLYFSRDIAGVHFVVLYTMHRRQTDVRLPGEQLAWLERDLALTELPTIVVMHHPLGEMDLTESRWFSRDAHICYVAERREARAILERSRKVWGVFNGHVHWNHVDVIAGIPYVTLQSLTENIDEDAPGRPSRCYAVVDVTSESLFVRVRGEQPLRLQWQRPR